MKKSLGRLVHPYAAITHFDGNTGIAEIIIESRNKKVVIEVSTSCARTIVNLGWELVAKQREYAQRQWDQYYRLKRLTNYQEADDKT